MWILDKNKENLLKNFGGIKEIREDGSCYYDFGKSFYIEGYEGNNFNCGKIMIRSITLNNQDIIYKLIKENIIICVENPVNVRSPKELKEKIIKESR